MSGIACQVTVSNGVASNCAGVYDVEWYGAVGDGSTDDATAIQAAINAAGLAGGGVVYLPRPVHYHVATSLTVDKPNVTIKGTGWGTSFGFLNGDLTNGGSNGNCILTVTGDNFKMLDVQISNGPAIDIGAATVFTGWGSIMWIEGCSDAVLNNVYFKECGGVRGLGGREIDGLKIHRCKFKNISRSGAYIQDTCKNVHVTDSYFGNVLCNSPGSNRYLFATGYSGTFAANPDHLYFIRGLIVDNCVFEDNPSWEGIDCHGGEHIKITNNKVINTRIGINVQGASSSGSQVVGDNVLKHVVISGNTCDRGTAGTSLYGISVVGSSYGNAGNSFLMENVDVHDNVVIGHGGVDDNYGAAIHVKRSGGAKIHDNIIEDFSQTGIMVNDSCARIEVNSNTIRNAGTQHFDALNVSCIQVHSGDHIKMTGNTLINTTDQIDWWFRSPSATNDSVSVFDTKFIQEGAVEPSLPPTGDVPGWFASPFNVRDFGAGVGRSASDNASSIQHAINLAEDIGGHEVYFPLPVVAHNAVTVTSQLVYMTGPGLPLDIIGGAPRFLSGAGSPEGVVTAPGGSLYLRLNGGAGQWVYYKESTTGNTGWVAQ